VELGTLLFSVSYSIEVTKCDVIGYLAFFRHAVCHCCISKINYCAQALNIK